MPLLKQVNTLKKMIAKYDQNTSYTCIHFSKNNKIYILFKIKKKRIQVQSSVPKYEDSQPDTVQRWETETEKVNHGDRQTVKEIEASRNSHI